MKQQINEMQTQRDCWVFGMIVSLDVFREEDENRRSCFVMFFSSSAGMIVAWGHSRTLWDPSLEKSIPPLISVFCGVEITAVKWRFIRGERVVAVGLSWDKPTAGQVRSASLSTSQTQIGLICRPNLFIWGSMEGRVTASSGPFTFLRLAFVFQWVDESIDSSSDSMICLSPLNVHRSLRFSFLY